MKTKKAIVIVALSVVLLAALCVPYKRGDYDDGGSTEFTAIAYTLVKWNMHVTIDDENGDYIYLEIYDKAKIYIFPLNLKSFDELRQIEYERAYKDLYERYEAGLLDLKY